MSDLATVIDQLKDILFWLPRWASASIIIASVCAVALCLHGLALRFVRRARAGKAAFTKLLVMRAANPTRFAIVLLALAAVVPVSGLPSATQQQFIAPLTSLFILLVGWSCLAAVGLAGDLYLDRFKTGFEDALARKHVTQVRLLRRAAQVLMALITVGAAMMTLPAIRQYGVSLFASAGAAGIVVGLAARPLLSNLLAGIQIAITQPVKIEDSVVINNEWGWVEDITSTYLVVRTWDWRRLIVPLSWFLEQPIQNWTRETTTIIGQVRFYVDYRTPIEDLRQELDRLVHASKLWDGNVATLQVVEANETTIQIRVLATSSDAGRSWDLQCELREKMIAYLQREHPDCLPRRRIEVTDGDPARSEFPPPRSRSFSAGTRGS
jgi:small-conductance mechanosensitive channel